MRSVKHHTRESHVIAIEITNERKISKRIGPDDAAGAAFILLAVGVLIVASVIITAALLIADTLVEFCKQERRTTWQLAWSYGSF